MEGISAVSIGNADESQPVTPQSAPSIPSRTPAQPSSPAASSQAPSARPSPPAASLPEPPRESAPRVITAPASPPANLPPASRSRPMPPVASYRIPAAIPREGAVYMIRWGDTLWDIAEAFYRNPWLYPRIARYNSIRNPDLIISGTNIRVPPR
jgi:nucleoid-associated protein YgaU